MASYGYYENERSKFKGWEITGNKLTQFVDGVKIDPMKAGLKVLSTTLTGNAFSAKLTKPRGIYLEGVANAPASGFIGSLRVNGNLFGCGFRAPVAFPPFPSFPPNAFVRPRLQAHTGNIGLLIPCQ